MTPTTAAPVKQLAPLGERLPLGPDIQCPMCQMENVGRAIILYVTRLRLGLAFECDSCGYHWESAEVVK